MTDNSPVKVVKACILGAGAFGFALAKLLGDNNPDLPIMIYDPMKDYIEAIIKTRQHATFHKGVTLAKNVVATHDLKEAINGANLVVLAAPGAYIRGAVKDIVPLIKIETIIINVAKALEPVSNKFLSEVCDEELSKCTVKTYFGALAGGMIAEEVTKLYPIAADLACENLAVGNHVRKLFQAPTFKINCLDDVVGVELAGALKNVVAIGAGLIDGLGYDTSSKAAYVSEAAKEMQSVAINLGAKPTTFGLGSHAWLNDLLTTCFGPSRNRYFGELIGKGDSVKDALAQLDKERKRSEGYVSLPGFYKIVKEKKLSAPILEIIHGILFEDKPVKTINNVFVVNNNII